MEGVELSYTVDKIQNDAASLENFWAVSSQWN